MSRTTRNKSFKSLIKYSTLAGFTWMKHHCPGPESLGGCRRPCACLSLGSSGLATSLSPTPYPPGGCFPSRAGASSGARGWLGCGRAPSPSPACLASVGAEGGGWLGREGTSAPCCLAQFYPPCFILFP